MKMYKHFIFNLFLFVFFSVLFLSYDNPYDYIFLIISLYGLIRLAKNKDKIKSFKMLIIVFIFIIIFYGLSILFLYIQNYEMKLIKNNNVKIKSETAVLLVYKGECNKYNLPIQIRNIVLTSSKVDIIKTPFILYNNKIKFKAIGKSNYSESTKKMCNDVQTNLSNGYKVYCSYLYNKDYLEEVVFRIANDGYRRIIIVPMLLTDDDILNNIKSRVDSLKLYNLNIEVKYTNTFWDSERIAGVYLKKIWSNVNRKDISNIGILLIGKGQKEYGSEMMIKSYKQDLMFRNKIKKYLIGNFKFEENKIRLCWKDKIQPDYIYEIRNLLEYGVAEILCIYIDPSATNLDCFNIKNKILRKIELPEGVKVRIIDGMLVEDGLLNEINTRVEFTNLQKWQERIN